MADTELDFKIKSNIDDAAKDAEKFGDNIGKATEETKGLAKETENVGEASKKSVSGVKKLAVGFKTLATATGFIFLVTKAFEIFKEVLGKNQKVVDFFNVAMETLSIAFNDLFGFLENNIGNITGWFKDIFENPKQSLIDFGEAIKDNIIERFDSLLEVFGHLGKAIGHLFKGEFAEAFDSVKAAGKESVDVWTGVDDSVDKITETVKKAGAAIADYTKETYKNAKATIELNKAAEIAAVQVQGLIEEYDRQAEKLRQVRDDETKTFAERIEANAKLGEVLKEQGEEMQKLVDIQVAAAQVEYNKNKSQENLIVLTEALNERKAVEAQITGFQSEQLTNQVSLERELGETQNEVRAEGLSGLQRELEELQSSYELKKEMARKSGMDTTAITEQYEQEQDAIRRSYIEPLLALQQENTLALIENLHDRALAELKIQEDKDLASAEMMENAEAIKDQIRIKYARKRGEVNKKEEEAKIKRAEMTQAQQLGIASSTAGNMAKILGEETEAGKAFAVTQATIDTFASAQAAFKSMAGIPYVGPVLGAIAAAAAVAGGIANIKAIQGASSSGVSGGGGGTPSSAPSTPSTTVASGAFTLEDGIEPEAFKAYVVTDDMTNNQNKLANIRRRATI